ncbi:hypothetical protein [Corynebacterium glaucum]|uniref:hypothetical protein n=1 Tax=Corynebacterium glaucum TaxID=187491 RepID=UPI0025B525F4|nr:hypothetical protein [Corynebacterium glaucum]WJZ08256.1 hypothetical protein CGLAUT_08885 [Corynebacterium glaucum]
MKKPLLAVTAAAALTIASVISPSGAHLPTATAAEGSSVATGAAAALGVLAIVRGGAYLAVQQGLISIPGLPPLPAIPGFPAKRGNCAPAEFDRVVAHWPGKQGTTVVYCDGQFATAGAIGTSETVHFIFRNGRWEILNYDGYTTNAHICTPAEIGR